MTSREREDMPSVLDGRLVQLLDGEVTGPERDVLETMIESDDTVRARFERLSAMSTELSELLDDEPLPPLPVLDLPRRTRGARRGLAVGWKAAAAAVVLLGVGLTVEPVRAWLVESANRIADVLSQDGSEAVPVVPDADSTVPTSVSFLPGDGGTFVVDIVASQDRGTLTIEAVVGRREVTASVVGGSGEALVVLPSGLRIANGEGSSADYRIRIPSHVGSVQVRIAGASVATLDPSDPTGTWDVALTR